MLVISRKSGEYLMINDNIFIKVIEVEEGGQAGDKVKLAIEAPDDVKIARAELSIGHDELKRRLNSIHSERLGRKTHRELKRLGLISDPSAEESVS